MSIGDYNLAGNFPRQGFLKDTVGKLKNKGWQEQNEANRALHSSVRSAWVFA